MWIVVDLLAIVGAYHVCAWIGRWVWGSDADELPYQPPIVLHPLKGTEIAVPAKPAEIKAKRPAELKDVYIAELGAERKARKRKAKA